MYKLKNFFIKYFLLINQNLSYYFFKFHDVLNSRYNTTETVKYEYILHLDYIYLNNLDCIFYKRTHIDTWEEEVKIYLGR